jgi:hypothetical protein
MNQKALVKATQNLVEARNAYGKSPTIINLNRYNFAFQEKQKLSGANADPSPGPEVYGINDTDMKSPIPYYFRCKEEADRHVEYLSELYGRCRFRVFKVEFF